MAVKLILGVEGRDLYASHVRLYPADEVNQWRELITQTQIQTEKPLTGLNLSLLGSPAWIIGKTVVNTVLNATLSGAARKLAMDNLTRANALMDHIKAHGVLFPVGEVVGIDRPNPKAWVGVKRLNSKADKSGQEAKTVLSRLVSRGITTKADADALSGVIDKVHIALDDDFVTLHHEGQDIQLRWSKVSTCVLG